MRSKFKLIPVILCLGLLIASQALAAPNAAFTETGFIQDASVTAGGAANAGGTITVNGKVMTVPANSIVQFPASAWTWADLFNPAAWAPVYGPNVTPVPVNAPAPAAGSMGLALNDQLVNHFPSHQVTLVGNIITNPRVNSAQNYRVGLIVPIEQQGLNNHSGYINYIDYTSGRFRIGGTINDPLCNPALAYGGTTCSGTLVEINDPIGRYGKIHSPDQRFSADTTNPTITAATGYPVCIPRTTNAAAGVGDPFCPDTNRPLNTALGTPNQPHDPFILNGKPLKIFTMPSSNAAGTTTPDPWQMVPLKVGDWVDVAGTIFKINPTLANPAGSQFANQYVSAHTVTANLSIKTSPNTKPAYVRVEGFIFGVGDGAGGPTVSAGVPLTPIGQETSTRIQFVMFTTDADASAAGLAANCADAPSPLLPSVALFGVDTSNANGNGVDALVAFPGGTTNEQSATFVGGPNFGGNSDLCMDNSVIGRVRWQTAKRSKPPVPGQLDNAAGTGKFYREYIVKLTGQNRGQVATPDQNTGQGGLISGQYRFPIFEYIFGEVLPFGQPTPPFNFNDFGFLFLGPNALTPFPDFQ